MSGIMKSASASHLSVTHVGYAPFRRVRFVFSSAQA